MLGTKHKIAWLVGCMSLTVGCAGEIQSGQNSVDASGDTIDTNPNAPDANPNAPDANPAMVSGCSSDALELISLVNVYRAENGLPAIPASPSLCVVGGSHVVDLNTASPHTGPGCNLHSWSDQGTWSACCYTPDHAQAQCMWNKPRELSAYTGNGYENAAGGGGAISPAQALNLWKGSPGHNDVILNQGIWTNKTWQALGAGLQDGYAVLWFGDVVDPGL